MMRNSFLLFVFLISLFSISSASANVEYACGTKVGAGSFYSETGRIICSDESGEVEKELRADKPEEIKSDATKEIFCFYQATCTPITKQIRDVLIVAANGKNWSDLSDDEINQTVMGYLTPIHEDAVKNLKKIPFEVHEHAVQCLGTKVDGKANCPSVNDCINNRKNASAFWKIQRLNPPFKVTPADSKGYRMRDQGTSLPKLQEKVKR